MKPLDARMVIIGLLMLAGAGLALAMKPTQKLADTREKPDLAAMIPQSFDRWKVDTSVTPIQVSPDVQAKLDAIYNQTLSRTYVDTAGHRIMLSVAYGGDQSDAMQVHRPEVCYAVQGFDVSPAVDGILHSNYGELPVKRLAAWRGNRNEPITYWVVVGDIAIPVGIRQKLAQLRYGLLGKVPDGFLVRVSSIDHDRPGAYQRQEEFIKALFGSMSEKDRVRFGGRGGD